MFPNQPPPTSTTAAAGTSQTVTTTTTAQGATSVTLTPAVVGAANTADMPETTAAQVLLPRAVQQGAQRVVRRAPQSRSQPYHRRTPVTQATGNLPQRVVTAAQGYQPARGAAGQAASSAAAALAPQASSQQTAPSIFAVCRQQTLYLANSLSGFFNRLNTDIGLCWDGNCTSVNGCVSSGAVSSSALSFSDEAIQVCSDPTLKELLLRVNAESVSERRAYLLVKALRAFNELSDLLADGMLTSFCFLLGIPYHSVLSWQNSFPGMATAAARGARANAPLTMCLPVDILSWPEFLRFLQEHFSLESEPVAAGRAGRGAAAEPTPRASIAGLTFSQGIIQQNRHIPELCEMLECFNQGIVNEAERSTYFAKIICVLKDRHALPLPIHAFPRLCGWLDVSYTNIMNWTNRCKKRINEQFRSAASTAVFVPQSAAATAPLQSATAQPATPSLTPAAIVCPAPLTFPIPAAAVSAAPSVVQAPTSPLSTTATAPAIPSTSAVTQLTPTLQPVTRAALEDLFGFEPPQLSASDRLKLNMAMSDEEMLSLFDD
ncbi:MAG: hypothetical protein ACRCWB_04070 [Enterovibrio sp.]